MAEEPVEDVLSRLPKGKQSWVRTVPDQESLESTFEELTQGGKPTSWEGYDGTVVERPDGVEVGMRASSRSGGATIDIRVPGQKPYLLGHSDSIYVLPPLGESARHPGGWMVGQGGFHEYVAVDRAAGRLTVVVASDD